MAVTIDGTSGITTVGLTASGSASFVGLTASGSASLVDTDVEGPLTGNVTAVAASDIDCSAGNYFVKTINGATTFTFSNVPTSGTSFGFTLELTVTSGSATWPAAVKWPNDTAPTLGTGKTSLLIFITDDGGTRWRGASLVDYTT